MIPVAEPLIDNSELELVVDCIQSGWVSSHGKYITQFEQVFSAFCEVKYGVATCNGTAALHLALRALEIGPKDEVVVPTLTFIATVNAVRYVGATPLFVDSDPDTWCMDVHKIEESLTPRTKAIIPVHLYGHPCDMDPIMQVAKRYDLYVIEDAAEAHGAEYKGRRVGGFGNISCFSFFGNKIITTGEGGMCLTNDEELAQKMQWLRNQAMDTHKRYWYTDIGYNYRMTNIEAAIGVAQMEKIEEIIARKRNNAEVYSELLRNVEGVTLPVEKKWAKSVYWMYSVLIDENRGISRDELVLKLVKDGIETRPLFHPAHLQPPYAPNQYSLPVAEGLSRRGINLPSSAALKEEQIQYITQSLAKHLGR